MCRLTIDQAAMTTKVFKGINVPLSVHDPYAADVIYGKNDIDAIEAFGI